MLWLHPREIELEIAGHLAGSQDSFPGIAERSPAVLARNWPQTGYRSFARFDETRFPSVAILLLLMVKGVSSQRESTAERTG
jgi:hypothetical protein